MPLPYGAPAIGGKPMKTLGAARTPAASAYPAAAVGSNLGGPAPVAPSPVPPNPTAMQTYGGSTQQTDQMGRVTTTTPGARDFMGNLAPGVQNAGSTVIEDPDQVRRQRDQAAYNERQLDPYGNYIGPGATGGGGSSGGGGGGGAGGDGGGGGLPKEEILDIINQLKPSPPPPREQAPGLLAREPELQTTASGAAKSQGFARAKDNAGRVANSALRNLRSEMVSRGIEGSGVEGQLTGNILGETARGVSDASFAQERAAEDQQYDAGKTNYQGGITQRANDYGIMGTGFGGGVTQRGQDINAEPNMLSLAPTILSMLGRARY